MIRRLKGADRMDQEAQGSRVSDLRCLRHLIRQLEGIRRTERMGQETQDSQVSGYRRQCRRHELLHLTTYFLRRCVDLSTTESEIYLRTSFTPSDRLADSYHQAKSSQFKGSVHAMTILKILTTASSPRHGNAFERIPAAPASAIFSVARRLWICRR